MRWENLTAPDFVQAVRDVQGVCLLPIGVIEKHGEHLPMGTDYFRGQALADAVAQIEPAIVFPPYYFGQVQEARHQPGAIALSPQLLFNLLEEVCGEIARNGLNKIVIISAHGGNRFFLPHFARSMLYKRKDFIVYLPDTTIYRPYKTDEWKKIKQEESDGHAGEVESSEILYIHPELAKMDSFGGDGSARPRLGALSEMFTGIQWYAEYPDHYCGDGRTATAEKGKFIMEWSSQRLAKLVRAVKADNVLPKLAAEYYDQAEKPLDTPRKL
ncbi:MAG: creatininase family protein [Planctomycetaceae bacterium]|nr:MAG: creatininase family protein [Planctomycetaceae bacterium]